MQALDCDKALLNHKESNFGMSLYFSQRQSIIPLSQKKKKKNRQFIIPTNNFTVRFNPFAKSTLGILFR